MYYKLKDNYALRGWEKLPYVLVNLDNGATEFLNQEAFAALELCDGSVDVSMPFIPKKARNFISSLAENGVVERCVAGAGLAARQKYREYPARYIRQAHWSITGKCNYRCRHCYMSAPAAKFGELSHEEAMRVVRQLSDCGVMTVSLTGGEPLVRNDFLEIVDALLERDIRIKTIYSNGALVSRELLNALDARGIHPEFNMSYDGVGWHDWLRGMNGAEAAVDRAFELCRDMGFPTGAEMCLHEGNKHTLRESVKHLGSLGVKSVKTCPVVDVGAWREGGYGEPIGVEELYQVYLDYIPEYYEDGMPLRVMLGGFFQAGPSEPDRFEVPSYKTPCEPSTMCVCGHARHVMYISPEGRTLPCMALSGMAIQEEFPLITEQGLAKCLTDSRYMKLINTRASEYFELHEDCKNCKYALCCYGGCRADALSADEADIMGKSPGACELFKGGWVEKIIEAVRKVRPDATSSVLENPLWS